MPVYFLLTRIGEFNNGTKLIIFSKLIIYWLLYFFIGFSKGWKESFMSGDQEPWVFRGGLTADLQV